MKYSDATYLHTIYSGLGGAPAIAFSLIESEIAKNNLQHILFSGPRILDVYKQHCKKKKIKFSFIKKKEFKGYIKSIIFSYKKIKLIKPKIIFIHDFNFISCLLYKFFHKKTKLVFINHTTLQSPNYWKIKLACFFLFWIDAFVLLNEKDYDFLKKKYYLYKKNFFLIKNGININYFSRTKLYTKPKFNPKNKPKLFKIGIACRIDASRPYRLLVKTLLHPNIQNFNIILSVCGKGNDLTKFKKFVFEQNLKDRVFFEGFLYGNKLKSWFASLDLYTQTSFGEGMSTSVLQAISMKVPVIGSDVSGLNNFLNNKKKIGMLFKNNVLDLAKTICSFYKMNKKETKKIIDIQYKTLINKYSHLQMIKKYVFLIKKIQ